MKNFHSKCDDLGKNLLVSWAYKDDMIKEFLSWRNFYMTWLAQWMNLSLKLFSIFNSIIIIKRTCSFFRIYFNNKLIFHFATFFSKEIVCWRNWRSHHGIQIANQFIENEINVTRCNGKNAKKFATNVTYIIEFTIYMFRIEFFLQLLLFFNSFRLNYDWGKL